MGHEVSIFNIVRQSVQRLGYGLDDRTSISVILIILVHTCSGVHPASYPMGTGVSYPSSAEVKKARSYTFTPLIRFHDVVRNSAGDVFTDFAPSSAEVKNTWS